MTKAHKILFTIIFLVLAVALTVQYWPEASADPKSSDLHERLKAVSQLADRSDDESFEIVVELTDDPELRVARSAVRIIASRLTKASEAKLKDIAVESKRGALRGAAAAGLGYYKDTDCRLLTGMLLNDKDPAARAGAAKGLARLGDRAAIGDVLKAMADPDLAVRQNSYEALGKLTARWFMFSPADAEQTRDAQLKKIRRLIVSLRTPHGH